jgi:hypothetical protein
VFQLNTNTIGSFPTPAPFAVNVPETVRSPPESVAEADNCVETGFDKEPCLRFSVIEPEPDTVTTVGSVDSAQDNSPEQVQLSNVYPVGM